VTIDEKRTLSGSAAGNRTRPPGGRWDSWYYMPPEPISEIGVKLGKVFEPLRLVGADTAVFLPPAVVGLIGDADLLADLCNRLPLSKQHLRFTEMLNDLFRRVTFPRHLLPPDLGLPNQEFQHPRWSRFRGAGHRWHCPGRLRLAT
jgi:hypothetical protein